MIGVRESKINMTIFKTNLGEKDLRKIILSDSDLDIDYKIKEDILKNGLFSIENLDNSEEIYTLGIKDNAIWASKFSSHIEEILTDKRVVFTKDYHQFDSPMEAQILFFQKYIM